MLSSIWAGKAVTLQEAGKIAESLAAFDKALQINPGNYDAYMMKARVLKAMDKSIQAYNKTNGLGYNASTAAQENTTDQLMKKGYELSENGSYEQAIQAFDIAIGLMPANDTKSLAIAWEGKALALHYMGNNLSDMARDRYEMALQSYDKAIVLDPSFTGREAQLNKAGVLSEMGRYNNSSEILDKVIQTIPANDTIYASVVWTDKGSVLEKMGKYDEALNAFNRALEMNPTNMAAMQGKGSALKSLGRNSEAEDAFAKARELGYGAPDMTEENTSEGWYKKSQELQGNGSYEEASKAIHKAVELNPTNATLWDAKASILAFAATFADNRSEYNDSLKAQDKSIELDPKNPTLLVHKGFLIANLADISEPKNQSMYEEAVKEFDKAIELDPRNKEAWNWKGMVLDTRLNRSGEALAAYDRAIEIDGTNASDKVLLSNAWSAKGGALAKLGRYNESSKAFDKAIELIPQNAASVWYMKARVINASGRYDEAVKAYDKAIDLSKENVTAASAYEGKGTALFKLGKYDEAIKANDKAIELSPQLGLLKADAWLGKGNSLKALGRQADADVAFAKAKEQTEAAIAKAKELGFTG